MTKKLHQKTEEPKKLSALTSDSGSTTQSVSYIYTHKSTVVKTNMDLDSYSATA